MGRAWRAPMADAEEALAASEDAEAQMCRWHMDEQAWYQTVVTHWTKEVSAEDNDGVLGGWGGCCHIGCSLGSACITAHHREVLGPNGDTLRRPNTL